MRPCGTSLRRRLFASQVIKDGAIRALIPVTPGNERLQHRAHRLKFLDLAGDPTEIFGSHPSDISTRPVAILVE